MEIIRKKITQISRGSDPKNMCTQPGVLWRVDKPIFERIRKVIQGFVRESTPVGTVAGSAAAT